MAVSFSDNIRVVWLPVLRVAFLLASRAADQADHHSYRATIRLIYAALLIGSLPIIPVILPITVILPEVIGSILQIIGDLSIRFFGLAMRLLTATEG